MASLSVAFVRMEQTPTRLDPLDFLVLFLNHADDPLPEITRILGWGHPIKSAHLKYQGPHPAWYFFSCGTPSSLFTGHKKR